MMLSAKVKWGTSIHRFGQKFDHGLLSARWRWRARKTEKKKTFDFAVMDNQSWLRFDDVLRIKLQEKCETRGNMSGHIGHEQITVTDTFCVGKEHKRLTKKYDGLTKCVQKTMEEVVPEKKMIKKNGRTVSQKTKELHEATKSTNQQKSLAQAHRVAVPQ